MFLLDHRTVAARLRTFALASNFGLSAVWLKSGRRTLGAIRRRIDLAGVHRGTPEAIVIRIAVTQIAYDAIASTPPLGGVSYEAEPDEKGERLIWVEAAVLERLRTMRRAGVSYSDVILRLVQIEAKGRR